MSVSFSSTYLTVARRVKELQQMWNVLEFTSIPNVPFPIQCHFVGRLNSERCSGALDINAGSFRELMTVTAGDLEVSAPVSSFIFIEHDETKQANCEHHITPKFFILCPLTQLIHSSMALGPLLGPGFFSSFMLFFFCYTCVWTSSMSVRKQSSIALDLLQYVWG